MIVSFQIAAVINDIHFQVPPYMNGLKYGALYIAYFNSAINPVIYCGFNSNFRRGFLDAFKCNLIRKNNKVGTGKGVFIGNM